MTEQDEIVDIGQRVQRMRKLAGWTQARLARAASVSTSLVSQVEQGRTPASSAFVASVGAALGVPVAELYHQPAPRFGHERRDVAGLETAVMSGSALAGDGPIGDLDVLRRQVDRASALRRRTKYDLLAPALPSLIAELHSAAERSTGAEQRRALLLLAHTYNHARSCLDGLGSTFSGQAAERGADAATRAGDPVLASILTVNQGLALLHRGAYRTVDRLTDRARSMVADELATPDVLSARGYAHLRSTISTARSGDRASSMAHLAEARTCAKHIPPTANVHGTAFNRDNVTIHAVAMAVELGDGAEALGRAAPTEVGVTPSRLAHYYIDLSRAALLHGDRERTLGELDRARRSSPQITRYHPHVAETIRALATTDRRRTESVAGFARWAGIRV